MAEETARPFGNASGCSHTIGIRNPNQGRSARREQSIHWPDSFRDALVDSGLQVIRFDNRDSGLSTHLNDAPYPNLPGVLARRWSQAVRVVGSPGYPCDENEIAVRAGRAYDRCYNPIGTARQAVATVASGDRTERLRHLKVPILVIHGLADRMCDISGGRATAEAIPDAELITIEGMGQDLATDLRPQLAARIAEFVWRVERANALTNSAP